MSQDSIKLRLKTWNLELETWNSALKRSSAAPKPSSNRTNRSSDVPRDSSRAQVERFAGKLILATLSRQMLYESSPEKTTSNLSAACSGLVAIVLACSVGHAQDPGFAALFDGKTLAGWEGDDRVFRVEGGAIVAGSKTERIAHNEFLASKEEFGDFELRLKAKLTGKGQNAGVQFRSQRIPNHFEMIGYQCDMGTTAQGTSIWGALYDESRRRKFLVEPDQEKLKAVLKPGDWNDLVIRCEGPRVQIWVNGLQTVDYTEPDGQIVQRGRFGLQIHGGEAAEAGYKDIRVRRL